MGDLPTLIVPTVEYHSDGCNWTPHSEGDCRCKGRRGVDIRLEHLDTTTEFTVHIDGDLPWWWYWDEIERAEECRPLHVGDRVTLVVKYDEPDEGSKFHPFATATVAKVCVRGQMDAPYWLVTVTDVEAL